MIQSADFVALIIGVLVSFAATVAAVWLIRRYLSSRLKDVPQAYSLHDKVKTRGGGAGFFAAALIGVLVFETVGGAGVVNLRGAGWMLLPLVLAGLWDDMGRGGAVTKLACQALTAVMLVYYLSPLLDFESLTFLKGISAALGIVALVFLINIYNFMDGIDGLVAGCSALQFVFIGLLFDWPVFIILASALFAFLIFNWQPAKVFMGDAGSHVLGAVVAIALLRAPDTRSCLMILTLTLPLTCDALYTFLRRTLQHQSFFGVHRSHVFQRAVQGGASHALVSATYMGLTAAIGFLLLLLK